MAEPIRYIINNLNKNTKLAYVWNGGMDDIYQIATRESQVILMKGK